MSDLIILAADRNIQYLLDGFLPRLSSQGITRPFTFEIIVHSNHDNGCLNTPEVVLRPFLTSASKAMVIFDFEGSGKLPNRVACESQVNIKITRNGWHNRSETITISPEVENWIWVNSPSFDRAIESNLETPVYEWAVTKGFIPVGQIKPTRPKETFEEILKLLKKPRSSTFYKEIGKRIPFQSCQDPAFLKMVETLTNWFPIS